MSQNTYEGMFLLDSNRYSSDPGGVTNRIHDLIQRHGGEMLASRPWDERRLAYSIKGHRKGFYYLTYFRMDGPEVANLEKDCQLFEPILRQLILKVDRQLVDQLLTQVTGREEAARGEEAKQAEGASKDDGEPSKDTKAKESK